MLFAESDGSVWNIDGCAEGVAPAETKPERNESILHVFLQHLLEGIDVKLEIEDFRVVLIGNWSFVKDVFDGESFLWAYVAALAEVTHKFKHIRVVSQYVEILHLFVFGCMHTAKNRFSRRVAYNATSWILQQKLLRQSQNLCRPIHYNVLQLCECWWRRKWKVRRLVYNCKHICENICHVYLRGVEAEEFGRLPPESARKDDLFSHLHQILNLRTLLRWTHCELVSEEARFDMRQYMSLGIVVDLNCALFDQIHHLFSTLLKGFNEKEFIWHFFCFILIIYLGKP